MMYFDRLSEHTGYTDSASPRWVSRVFRQPVKIHHLTDLYHVRSFVCHLNSLLILEQINNSLP